MLSDEESIELFGDRIFDGAKKRRTRSFGKIGYFKGDRYQSQQWDWDFLFEVLRTADPAILDYLKSNQQDKQKLQQFAIHICKKLSSLFVDFPPTVTNCIAFFYSAVFPVLRDTSKGGVGYVSSVFSL